MSSYVFPAPVVPSLPVRGSEARFPVRRLFFIGRNYLAHALEMGLTVNKASDPAFYFLKSPHALLESGATVAYPPGTQNYHHELELVLAIGASGFQVEAGQAHELIYGYATGLDMTRRDLQASLRSKGQPWDLAKDVEQSAVCSEIVPMPQVVLEEGEIALTVNGEIRQQSDIRFLIWNVREIIADLSRYYHLQAGDLIYTGTPEGVGPVRPGDVLRGHVVGVSEVCLNIEI